MLKLKILIAAAVVVLAAGLVYKHGHNSQVPVASAAKTVASPKSNASNSSNSATPATNYCRDNTLTQNIVISIGRQHLWACENTKSVYDSPVVTGMEMYPADLTPTGTYHIYGKQTDQTLTGSDDTGSWSDFVNYWMPFLDNQYGTYGFHDLTQTDNGANGRADSDFGNIDINAPYTAAKHGSHGCVELPLATAKWIYNWSVVGTTVTIQS